MTAPGADLAAHLRHLHALGLHPLACWGGGKTMPCTDHRALADNPPMLDAILAADYSGGLAILNGTAHPAGGYVVGLDIDQGPRAWPRWPLGTLMAELGTRVNSWHVWVLAQDRHGGVSNLRDDAGALVAELKGWGTSLRAWPTVPQGKPRGYRQAYMANPATVTPSPLTTRQIAEGLADYLTHVLGQAVAIDEPGRTPVRQARNARTPDWLAVVYDGIIDDLARRGLRVKPTRDGGATAQCPLHDDRSPSLSVHPERGWKCHAGCGQGRLTTLAHRMGLRIA